MATEVQIQGKNLPVVSSSPLTPELMKKAVSSVPFQDWVAAVNKQDEYRVNSIDIQSIDLFGPNIGFIKFKADITNREGIAIPSIVFMRGGAVGILIILVCEGEEYTILTVQPRVPIGNFNFPEIPAGMIDGSGHFVGKAAAEIREETGLDIEENALIDMTALAYGDKFQGIYPSPGGCDEFIRLFVHRRTVDNAFLNNLEGKLTGLREHGELITLKVVKLSEAWKHTSDVKLLSSLYLYQNLRANKLLQV